jgi:mRNA interferase HigB
MRVISKKTLIDFWRRHPAAEQPLKAWFDEATKAHWETPQQIKDQYRNASIVAGNRIVFNIHGNKYRLIVAVAYRFGAAYIKFIGTHAEYDAIDAATVDQ